MSSIVEKPGLIGHNGGPPLEEHIPPWGPGPIGSYFNWKKARKAAFSKVSREVALMRLERARRIGLTYEEYTLEILDRGRHLQPEDSDRIAAIKQARRPISSAGGY
jgi:hypothetical protein